jgi:hypothetical protein
VLVVDNIAAACKVAERRDSEGAGGNGEAA